VKIKEAYDLPAVSSQHYVDYILYGSGDLIVTNRFKPGSQRKLPEMYRFGMRLQIPEEFEKLEYYGRGPHENYWDRKTSAFVGHYRSSVNEQFVPYISPQENGYRTDVRWLALSNETGKGVLFQGLPLICFSALHFTIEDLTQEQRGTRHTIDLKPRPLVELNIDYKQTGVGGNNSWGALPLPKYTLYPAEYSYTFRIRPFSNTEQIKELTKFDFTDVKK
ncbi:MAG: beta-galactosidase small subunit, partial [Candidatus Aminicenantales bacterium]